MGKGQWWLLARSCSGKGERSWQKEEKEWGGEGGDGENATITRMTPSDSQYSKTITMEILLRGKLIYIRENLHKANTAI